MSLAKILSSAVIGLDAKPIEVEVDLTSGLHLFSIVGLPDMAVKEAKERVFSALKNSRCQPPQKANQRIIVNLAPADIKKEGVGYDLPIAIGYLLASEQIIFDSRDKLFIGELSLDGKIRSVPGILPMTLMAKEMGIKTFFVPKENIKEASLIQEVEIIGAESVNELILHLEGKEPIKPTKQENNIFTRKQSYPFDMSYIKGQESAKRALEIASAGAHNILMSGPPGAGKTLLSRALASIMPEMSIEEALEVTKIYSISGKIEKTNPLITTRPFRNPHHTASSVALIGGGQNPRPGEISMAHRGVLFLDEFPEFHRDVLESLRQPLEDNVITVSRASGTMVYPAKFMLVAAMNPCPCGNLGHARKLCSCTPTQTTKYKRKISGPLLDRIDIHIEVPEVKYEKLREEKLQEDSESIRKRVEKARFLQKERFAEEKDKKILTNSEMTIPLIKKYCKLEDKSELILKNAMLKNNLSARSFHKILKLSRTIADLAEEKDIKPENVAEAVQYRIGEDINL